VKKIFITFCHFVEKLTSKKIFFYSPNEHNVFGKTAVKTKFGFWYVGDILDQRDIACGILRHGQVEPEETTLTIKIFEYLRKKSNPIIFDIGANTGYYSLLAAHTFEKKVEVYSFEPVKEFASCINESAKINNYDDCIDVCNFALSDKNGDGQIYVWGTCSSLDKNFNNKNLPSQTIKLKKLDDFSVEISPDFIKIDTEGHELATLQGGIETIRASKPILFIEIIQSLKMRNYVNKEYKKTIQLLMNLGYEVYLFKDNMLTKTDGDIQIEGVYMYLFIDKNKHEVLLKNLLVEHNNLPVLT
jgi:FkbM family methyltransferase